MAASRAGASFKSASRCLISFFHSGMFGPGDAIDCRHKGFPGTALCRQDLLTFPCQAVITAPPLAGFLHPTAFDPAAFFQPVEERVERSYIEFQHAVRPRLDQLADFITMTLASLQKREDQQFSAALLQLAVEN